MDMGNIYHDALWHFAERIRRSSYTWYDLPEQTREAWIEESMNDAIAGCANVGAFDEAKNRYLLSRMKDTIRRTVWALTIQVQKGVLRRVILRCRFRRPIIWRQSAFS